MNKKFYGSVTVGERGQIVIPAEAREELGLKAGEKLLVFKVKNKVLAITKPSGIENFLKKLELKLDNLREIVKENKDNE